MDKENKEVIPEVIVAKDAKNQKKSKKANSFIEKNKLPLLVIGIIVILAIIYFTFFFSPYKYRFDIEGISYVSNDFVPTQFFKEFKQNNVVYISPILTEGTTDALTFNAMNLWQIVLIGNKINAVQMIRVKDSTGNFAYCYTNDGNVYVSRKVENIECSAILNNSNNAIIFIEQVKDNKDMHVLLEKNKLSIFSTVGSVSTVNFSVMKQIFPNAKQLIDIVNEKIYGIQ